MQGGSKVKIYILVILVVCVGLLHFLIPTDSHTSHKVHIILRKLYYLPPVMAGAWFGLRWGLSRDSGRQRTLFPARVS